MLGKLLKHEFKATSRYFIPLFLVALLLTPLTRMATSIPLLQERYLQVIPVTLSIAYVTILICMIGIAFVIITYRYYKNMITDEGYLTHTLPVKATTQIISKLITSCIWLFFSFIVIITSIICFFITPKGWNEFWNVWSEFLAEVSTLTNSPLSKTIVIFFIELLILIILSIIYTILFIYAAISIGQVLLKTHRVLGSFLAGLILYIVNGIVSFSVTIPMLTRFSIKTANMYNITGNLSYEQEVELSLEVFQLLTKSVLPYMIFVIILFGAVHFFLSAYITQKHLNLE